MGQISPGIGIGGYNFNAYRYYFHFGASNNDFWQLVLQSGYVVIQHVVNDSAVSTKNLLEHGVSVLQIRGDGKGEYTTFNSAMSGGWANQMRVFSFFGASDNPFSFSNGYVLAFNSGMYTTANKKHLIGIDVSSGATEWETFTIS